MGSTYEEDAVDQSDIPCTVTEKKLSGMRQDSEFIDIHLHRNMLLGACCVLLTILNVPLASVILVGQVAQNPSAVTTCAAEAMARSRTIVPLCIGPVMRVVDVVRGLKVPFYAMLYYYTL